MPQDWVSEAALKQNNRESEWRLGGAARKTLRCRVLGAATKPSNSGASYWNVVVLADGDNEIDLKASGVYPSNVLPVRPILTNVADGPDAAHSAGAIVTVNADVSSIRRGGVVFPGNATEDYVEMFPGEHFVMTGGSGSGGCYASMFFGSLVAP